VASILQRAIHFYQRTLADYRAEIIISRTPANEQERVDTTKDTYCILGDATQTDHPQGQG